MSRVETGGVEWEVSPEREPEDSKQREMTVSSIGTSERETKEGELQRWRRRWWIVGELSCSF